MIQVITAARIKVPLMSDEIIPSCSAIFAAAITSDRVDVNKKEEAVTVFASYHFSKYQDRNEFGNKESKQQ
jgi:hypothetical protein